MILPFAVDRFRETSVVDRPGDWGALFDGLVADATAHGDLVILEAGDGDQAFAATNLAILAEGERLASATSARRRALIVWDGAAREGRRPHRSVQGRGDRARLEGGGGSHHLVRLKPDRPLRATETRSRTFRRSPSYVVSGFSRTRTYVAGL